MATSGKMIEVIAAALSQPKARVTSYYSALRKAELISTNGRGKSAQHLTSKDVTRILLAMLTSDNIDEVADATTIFGNCIYSPNGPVEESDDNLTLEQSISNIIDTYADLINNRKVELNIFGIKLDSEIKLFTNNTRLKSQIRIDGIYYPFIHYSESPVDLVHPNDWENLTVRHKLLVRPMFSGMSTRRSISHFSIKSIARHMP